MAFSLIEPQQINTNSVLVNTAYDTSVPEYLDAQTYSAGEQASILEVSDTVDISIASPANISVTPSATGTEIIANGHFTTDTAGWAAASKNATPVPTLSADAGRLKMQANAGGLVPRAIYQLPVVAGTTYEVSIDYETYGLGRCDFLIGGSSGNLVDSVGIGNITGTLTETLRFTSTFTDPTGTYIQLRLVLTSPASGAEYAHFDNVSVKEVTPVAHQFLDGDTVSFTTTDTLPTGITAGQSYFVSYIDAFSFNLRDVTSNTLITTSGTQAGVHTATVGVNSVYESLTAANTGNNPRTDSGANWLRFSATNNFKMFDTSPSNQTINPDEIYVKIQCSGITDAVALLNINASNIRFRMQDTLNMNTATLTIASPCVVTQVGHGYIDGQKILFSTTGALPTGLVIDTTYYIVNSTTDTYELSLTDGGASIDTSGSQSGVHTAVAVEYDNEYDIQNGIGGSNWFSYFYDPITRDSDYVELDFPRLDSPIVEVWMTATGESVTCGGLIVGRRFDIGDSEMGATTGIQDYSVKTTDTFGNVEILQRGFAKRGNFRVWLDGTRTSSTQQTLTKYRSTPIVYVGSPSYANTILYGFFKDFTMEITMENTSICDLYIEGLK